jgi:hypothetical protein
VNLFQRLRAFITGRKSIENFVFTSPITTIGKGTVLGLVAEAGAVNENWTFLCTTAGGNGVAQFSLTGSVSGSLGTVTVGTPYYVTNPTGGVYTAAGNKFSMFGIENGGVNYHINDAFTFSVVSNNLPVGQRWQELRYIPGIPNISDNLLLSARNPAINTALGAVVAYESVFRGPGLAAADNVYFSMGVEHSASAYPNLSFRAMAGFNALVPGVTAQPIVSTVNMITGWPKQSKYWFVVNGRRIIIAHTLNGKDFCGHIGLLLPYATPSEYPYPMYTCGTSNYHMDNTDESHNNRSFFDPYAGYLYQPTNLWKQIQNVFSSGNAESRPTTNNVWPYEENLVYWFQQSPGGGYPLLPMILHSSEDGGNVFGEIEGAFWVPGKDNQSQNLVSIDGTDYVVLQNGYRTGSLDYCAIKLE